MIEDELDYLLPKNEDEENDLKEMFERLGLNLEELQNEFDNYQPKKELRYQVYGNNFHSYETEKVITEVLTFLRWDFFLIGIRRAFR